MNAANFNVDALREMQHSRVDNYVIPGLSSFLIGNPSKKGTIRMFECSRNHQESITPHSHRFAFQAWVLRGRVTNRRWAECGLYGRGDTFVRSHLHYDSMGKYQMTVGGVGHYGWKDVDYKAGECYSMQAEDIHSIYFDRDTSVLFFEGPTTTDTSVILEPFVDGSRIPTFKVEPWMFDKGGA